MLEFWGQCQSQIENKSCIFISLGVFAYIDAEPPSSEGDVAAFVIDGPPTTSGGDFCMTFYRHMRGSDIGRLFLRRTGEQQLFHEVTGGTCTAVFWLCNVLFFRNETLTVRVRVPAEY